MKKKLVDRKSLFDNGGRRSGADRRQFSFAVFSPERRVAVERRTYHDRREFRNYVATKFFKQHEQSNLRQ